jgi:hypothetical protein
MKEIPKDTSILVRATLILDFERITFAAHRD